MKSALVQVRSQHLAGEMYILQNLDCLGFALIFGEREQFARGLGHLIKECLLCFQKGFPVIGQVLPHLCRAGRPSGHMQQTFVTGRLSQSKWTLSTKPYNMLRQVCEIHT